MKLREDVGHRLTWWPALGYGNYPVVHADEPYDEEYFERYRGMATTAIGRQLNAFRVTLVARWARRAELLDVGIGDGAFIEWRDRFYGTHAPETWGYDVNPAGVAWLEERGRFGDLYGREWPVLTFWDSLEHILEPEIALRQAQEWAFVTIPTFRDAEHVLESKHFRPTEHRWYWTRWGFVAWAERHGFETVEHLTTEELIGREDVETFVLRRAG